MKVSEERTETTVSTTWQLRDGTRLTSWTYSGGDPDLPSLHGQEMEPSDHDCYATDGRIETRLRRR